MPDAFEQTRAARDPRDTEPPPAESLPTQQRRVLETIREYQRATGEPCPARFLGRRLNLHHTTILVHIGALHRKGWLRTPHAPAWLKRSDD
jgi:LexA DNA binding domain